MRFIARYRLENQLRSQSVKGKNAFPVLRDIGNYKYWSKSGCWKGITIKEWALHVWILKEMSLMFIIIRWEMRAREIKETGNMFISLLEKYACWRFEVPAGRWQQIWTKLSCITNVFTLDILILKKCTGIVYLIGFWWTRKNWRKCWIWLVCFKNDSRTVAQL